ncbi:MAG TPA: hypothetical protein VKG85_02795 [Actinomycetes bacterium]|nr:hypothetical protein [Actinomycetes bacterium]
MHRFSGLLGWVAVTAAAFGISMAAVTLVGSSIGDPVANPLSAEQVRRQLELAGATASPSDSSTTEPTGPATGPTTGTRKPTDGPSQPAADGQRKLLSSAGGTVIARCTGGLVKLESWSPANGFRTNHVDSGPDTTAEIEFESEHDRYKLEISCRSGVPTAQIEHDERDGNSGSGGGDSGSGPG